MKYSEIVNEAAKEEFEKMLDDAYTEQYLKRQEWAKKHPIRAKFGMNPVLIVSNEYYRRKYQWMYEYGFRDGLIWCQKK